jgi:hypothetical protein
MRCPVCRADNGAAITCRRCRADLGMLVTLEKQRRAALAKARQALARNDTAAVLTWAGHAHQLRSDEDSWRLLAWAHLLRRDFPTASRCWRSCQQNTA